jgi:hypothetical protein
MKMMYWEHGPGEHPQLPIEMTAPDALKSILKGVKE